MHAGFLHDVNLLNRPRQLALQRLQIVYPVLKFRDAQLAVVKKFKALVAAR